MLTHNQLINVVYRAPCHRHTHQRACIDWLYRCQTPSSCCVHRCNGESTRRNRRMCPVYPCRVLPVHHIYKTITVSVESYTNLTNEGQVVFTNVSIFASGLCPSAALPIVSTSGSLTGNSSSGTGTSPHSAQCTIGMGVPQ
jgi:hypothetical protein